jgi:hypothetical protein
VLVVPFQAATQHRWILNQWLPEILMSWGDRMGGLAAVVWLFSIGVVGVFAALWVTCRRRASSLVASTVTVISLVAMSASISPRPQLVTFALTVVVVDTWLRTSDDLRARWWLVPLSWLWACSHGMWFIGPIIGLLVIVGMLLERRHAARRILGLGLVPLSSILITALTPVGPTLWMSPFQVREVTHFINEWQAPSSNYLPFQAGLVIFMLVLIFAARDPRGRRWTVVLLLLLAAVFLLTYVRTVAIAAAILAPLAANALQQMVGLVRESVGRRERRITAGFGIAAVALAALLSAGVAGVAGRGPVGLSPQLAALPEDTVVCNDMGDGGWLIYTHPNLRVTLDTRVELYSVAHVEDYLNFYRAGPGWLHYAQENNCSYALLPSDTAVVEGLMHQANWTETASADGYVLLRAEPTR